MFFFYYYYFTCPTVSRSEVKAAASSPLPWALQLVCWREREPKAAETEGSAITGNLQNRNREASGLKPFQGKWDEKLSRRLGVSPGTPSPSSL